MGGKLKENVVGAKWTVEEDGILPFLEKNDYGRYEP